MHARMQSLNSPIEHFWKCGKARDLAHRNFFLPQQVRRPAGRNDINALALEDARKRSHAGFVGNGNECPADFHRVVEALKG